MPPPHRRGKRLQDFDHGYICAVARLVECFDQPGMARDILKEGGYDKETVLKSDLATYDKKFIRMVD